MAAKSGENAQTNEGTAIKSLMTKDRWIETGQIIITGLIALLYWQELVPVYVLLGSRSRGIVSANKEGCP